MRVTKNEIASTIEMYVNCIYDEGDKSDWMTATFDEWVEVVYEEISNWKLIGSSAWKSNENRFDGKSEITERIRPILKNRLSQLKAEGYEIKAI